MIVSAIFCYYYYLLLLLIPLLLLIVTATTGDGPFVSPGWGFRVYVMQETGNG